MSSIATRQPRLNFDKEAIVDAAVKLVPKYGKAATLQFLLDAGIPVEVATRVLNGGPMRGRQGQRIG